MFVIFALVGAVFGFVVILGFVKSGATEVFDRTLLLAMRDPDNIQNPWGPRWVQEMARDFTALGGFPFLTLLTAALAGYLCMGGKKALAAIIVVATLIALLLSSGLKHVIDRARPDLVPHGQHVYTASFPSGHSMHSAATYLTLGGLWARFQRRRRIQWFILSFAVLIPLLVGISRVYLGVHWPTDVLGGWAAGTGCALLTLLFARGILSVSKIVEEEGAAVEHAAAASRESRKYGSR
ncbi:phosphatase PAP2 family protein [Saccharophagus sp. K07]|jgi:undecaprenyl-diphosphatase|uniref:phosphatase PAP2 family protein n=1 Tax=Saccharophagus sp. K07 TaxID=2283636 RepID=UPI001CA36A44|nr:phosphatase PAP2 family protein [Saccharophagus sp. K07]